MISFKFKFCSKKKGVPERFYLPPPIRNQDQTYATPKPSPGDSYQYTTTTNYKSNDASPSGQSDDRQVSIPFVFYICASFVES